MKNNIRTSLLVIGCLAAQLSAAIAQYDCQTHGPGFALNENNQCEYMPPIGIPKPEFGIEETYRMYDTPENRNPALAYTENGEGGFYTHYIDNTHPNADDDNAGGFGTADAPLKTLPKYLDLPAGSVVEIHGGPYVVGSWRQWISSGTVEQPVFIRGFDPANRIVYEDTQLRLGGQYTIVENLELYNGCSIGVSYGSTPREHYAIRNCEIHDDPALSLGGGASISGNHCSDLVIYNNHIHHVVKVNSRGEIVDSHGVVAGPGSVRTWIVDNTINNTSGDGVQAAHNAVPSPKFVYIGRNHFYDSLENAVDIKQSEDVIISQNRMHGYRDAPESDGTAIVVNNAVDYPKQRTWILFNEIFDAVNGIRTQDSTYIVGNIFYDIIESGLITWNNGPEQTIHFVNNTVSDAMIGFNDFNWGDRPISLEIINNIFTEMKAGGQHIEISGHAINGMVVQHNLFSQSAGGITISWDGVAYTNMGAYQIATGQGVGSLEGNPLLANMAQQDYQLSSGSPAIDSAAVADVYDLFFALYGIDIRVDFEQTIRPQGSGWDIGAFEFADNRLSADAGQDITVAPNVPVILDGSGSSDADGRPLTYFWQQVSGATLEVLGQDRSNALVISADQPGSYTFQLQVSNGVETNSDEMTVTIQPVVGNVLFVDNTLAGNITDGRYSIANRDASGTDGNAFATLQGAADAVVPGDKVYVRGGTFENTYISDQVYLRILHITTSGTATAPIRFAAYEDEAVILNGFGFEDRDLDQDENGYADGPLYSKKRETLVLIEGDYIQLSGFELQNSQGGGLAVGKSGGNYCYVEECVARDNWGNGFTIANEDATHLQGSVLRYVESFRSRHGNGAFLSIDKDDPGYLTHCAIVDCLLYDNGYQPDGNKVLPFRGDPDGGGNSDGTGCTKNFNDSAVNVGAVDNYGPHNFLVRNICYHNADDGIDTSFADSLIEDNYCLNNGPAGRKGFKMLREVRDMIYRGNFAYQNHERGFDFRALPGEAFTVDHNSSLNNGAQGILGGAHTSSTFRNNMCAFNGGNDFVPASNSILSNNWSEDGTNATTGFTGDPLLVNPTFVLSIPPPDGRSVRLRKEAVAAQITAAFRPQAGSPLIDAGIVIPGYHCATADDDPVNPMDPKAPGRHWLGAAPDPGAFEYNPTLAPPSYPAAPTNLRTE